MKKRRRLFLLIAAGVACLFISFLSMKFISDGTYRKQIPALPDFSNVSGSQKDQISEADKNARRHPDSDHLGLLGMVYNSDAYYDKAVQCYELAAKRDDKNWVWNYYLGYIKLEMGEPQMAIVCFRKVLMVNSKNIMALYYTGLAYQSLNSTDAAEKTLSMIAGTDSPNFRLRNTSRTSYFPVPVYAKFQLARIYMVSHRTDMAEKQLREIIGTQIAFGPAYRQLSSLFADKGDSTLSRYYSSRASDLIPFVPPADTLIDKLSLISRSDEFLLKQIDLAIKSTNLQWANDLLISGLRYFSDNRFFISKAVRQFLTTGRYENALPLLDRHMQFYRSDYSELVSVGIQLSNAGLKPHAKRYFLQAESLKQEEPEVRSSLALLLFEKVDMKEYAQRLMTEIVAKNPENIEVLIHGVSLFREINEKGMALQLLNRLRKLSPLHPKVLSLEGIDAEQEGKIEKAIALFEQSFKADPKARYVIDHLGVIYMQEKRWGKAIDFFRKAILYCPNYASIQVNLGGLLVSCPDESLRNFKEGIEYSERAYINYDYTVPIRISAGRNLAIAYESLGNRAKANYYINNAIDFARNSHVSKDLLKNLEDIARQLSLAR